ncbi:MAG: DUF885 family protein [Gemmatimonadales bacterium]|nr:DUF885 family protein [Gemmatimonadales bacterium]
MSTTASPLDALGRSALDLRWHFDPVAGSRAGVAAADERLGDFTADAVRQHVAALRAIASAVEDAELESLDDELDRTILLNALRSDAGILEREQPFTRDPGRWMRHAEDALAVLLDAAPDEGDVRDALLGRVLALPAFLGGLRETVSRPAPEFVAAALQGATRVALRLDAARQRLAGHAVEGSADPAQAVAAAADALARTGRWLADECASAETPHAYAIGIERFERRLHEQHALASSAAELWRVGLRLREETEGELELAAAELEPGTPWRDVIAPLVGDAVARALRRPAPPLEPEAAASETRRMFPSPVTARGLDLVVQERLAAGFDAADHRIAMLTDRLLHALLLELDVALHTRGMLAGDAVAQLEGALPLTRTDAALLVQRLCAEPTRGLEGAVGRRDLLQLEADVRAAEGAAYDPERFFARFRRFGLAPVSLMRWGMGLE